MSGLLFLSPEDFYVTPGTKGQILCNTISGFSLVLFYSTQCEWCKKLIPIFKTLPGSIGGCQFAIINVSVNKQIVLKSKETITPIKYVPYIILYIDGKPFMSYQGPHDANEIRKFIFEVSQKINNRQAFSKEDNIKQKAKNKIPEFTIGVPKCDENVCYLDFDEAYDK